MQQVRPLSLVNQDRSRSHSCYTLRGQAHPYRWEDQEVEAMQGKAGWLIRFGTQDCKQIEKSSCCLAAQYMARPSEACKRTCNFIGVEIERCNQELNDLGDYEVRQCG
ncbi:hypothetical protein AMAG_20408 [Allomyces macrogynus ATCC 38327]|uniref:Uncharacterized protein n=1 Tax=Allomyces macrogynus (strain ATCC 38327) TaxID=578462 RepID=A0A0L0T8N7_ALLM3|nr:hypothetical protein, variant [Allomyces macrogynus ATCC 38327]KNE71174.1 hypothetical protein AMAG_20408 [Allomyces macrogynus ATCC 38327]|eukprot:KNE71173.1 hypothetical protein, variant [Allomyces macrogynus ATCC 38327]